MQRVNAYRFTSQSGAVVQISFDGEALVFDVESEHGEESVVRLPSHEVSQLKVAADEMAQRYSNRSPSL